MLWNTDEHLQVTSVTARLRGFAGLGPDGAALHVSDLWGHDEHLAVVMAAHHWALEGEAFAFEAPVRGTVYQFEISPLLDAAGTIVGVNGRAVEATTVAAGASLLHVERTAGMGTWQEDLRTGAITISEGLAALLGTPRHVRQVDIRSFDHPDDRALVARALADAQGEDSYACDHRILCLGSRIRVVRERARTMYDERGVPVTRVGTIVDITDLKQRENELTELALQDPLTRLPNRVAFEERLASTIARSERNDVLCAVLFIDLDDFKVVNDDLGHDFGDQVLVAVATRLQQNVRASDMVARMGGDEFVVLVEDLYTDEAALDAGRKLLRSFNEPLNVEGEELRVSASIGVAAYPRSGTDPKALLNAADREMYAVKRNGGSGVKLASQKETTVTDREKDVWQAPSSQDRPHYVILESV